MELISILLLSILFIASLIYIYLNLHYYKIKPPPSTTTTVYGGASPLQKTTVLPQNPQMKKIFDTFDKNGDGFITKLELKESLKNIRITVTDIEVEEIVARVDENGDGLIDFEEFVTLCEGFEKAGGGEFYRPVGVHDDDDDEDLREAFDVFDKDKDGLICVEELDLVLCSLGLGKMKIDDCREMIRKVDVDGDGMVNFDEFKLMMTSNVLVSS